MYMTGGWLHITGIKVLDVAAVDFLWLVKNYMLFSFLK